MTRRTSVSELPARLRTAREDAGLTQAQVAKKLNLHRPSISEIEAGRRRVSAGELTAFADLYGVSVQWLASGDTNERAKSEVLLAARELTKLSRADLDRLVSVLQTLRRSGSSD
jgi:transcriptional regulator with XRE-family HTH domain